MGSNLEKPVKPSKFAFSDEVFLNCERKLLKQVPLPKGVVRLFRLRVREFAGQPVYMQTIVVNRPENYSNKGLPIMVFLHGYCASGSLFYKTYEHLVDHFQVIFVDIIGMGGSDHPEDFSPHKSSPEECRDYFVQYLEDWRRAFSKSDVAHKFVRMGPNGLDKFVLVGHSFGGFISGCYALSYPEHISKLILVSPIGTVDEKHFETNVHIGLKSLPTMTGMEERISSGIYLEDDDELDNHDINVIDLVEREMDNIVRNFFWTNIYSPQDASKFFGSRWTNSTIDDFLEKYQDRDDYTKQELEAMHDYIFSMVQKKGTSEYGLMVLFWHDLSAKLPLFAPENFGNRELDLPVSVLVGDSDWVPSLIGKKGRALINKRNQIMNRGKKEGLRKSSYIVCPYSAHNLQLDNPRRLCEILVAEVHGSGALLS